jgi:hypothetical protein
MILWKTLSLRKYFYYLVQFLSSLSAVNTHIHEMVHLLVLFPKYKTLLYPFSFKESLSTLIFTPYFNQ